MNTNYLKKYAESALANITKQLTNPDLSLNEKEKLNIRIELIKEFEQNLAWQIKSQTQKQALRIQKLATMRRTEALPPLIKRQEAVIKFYEFSNTVLPYIEALNMDERTEPLLDLLHHYGDKIDFAGAIYRGVLPTSKEVEEAFRPYFESIALIKYDMYNDCYERIEYLYKGLMNENF